MVMMTMMIVIKTMMTTIVMTIILIKILTFKNPSLSPVTMMFPSKGEALSAVTVVDRPSHNTLAVPASTDISIKVLRKVGD